MALLSSLSTLRNYNRIITVSSRCLTYRVSEVNKPNVLPVTMVKYSISRETNRDLKLYTKQKHLDSSLMRCLSVPSEKTNFEYQSPSKRKTEIQDIVNKNGLYDCPNDSKVNVDVILPTLRFFKDLDINRECPGIEKPAKLAKKRIRKVYSIIRIRQRKINRHKLLKLRKRMFYTFRKLKDKKKKKKEQRILNEIKTIYAKVDQYDPLGVIKDEIALARKGGYRMDVFGNMPSSK